MATLIVPLDSTYDHFIQTVDLDGTTYSMEFKFNSRTSNWAFDLSDALGNLLVGSLPAILGWPLLRQHAHRIDVPPGLLYFIDQTGADTKPGRFDLGQNVLLVYEEKSTA